MDWVHVFEPLITDNINVFIFFEDCDEYSIQNRTNQHFALILRS